MAAPGPREARGWQLGISGLLLSVVVSAACGAALPTKTVTSSSSLPPYNFAGFSTDFRAGTLQGIRATITWSVAPITSDRSAQSTWIGIAGLADQTTNLSFRIAQIGWKQLAPYPPRVFWESGTDRDHISIHYGATVEPTKPLVVEVDRDPTGAYSFLADGAVMGHVTLAWQPTYIAVMAETHHPSDVMAGSARMPEVISEIKWKLNGEWQPLTAPTYSTNAQYQTTVDAQGNILIWDVRSRTPS